MPHTDWSSCLNSSSNGNGIRHRKDRSRRIGFVLVSWLFLAIPAAAQQEQCVINLSISPASPVPFDTPVTITASLEGDVVVDNVFGSVTLDNATLCTLNQGPSTCHNTYSSLSSGSHTIAWTCSASGAGGDGSNSGSQVFSVGAAPTATGYINPKYLILSVQYAPPGAKSLVDYGTSTNVGTSNSVSSSFSNKLMQSVSVGFKTDSLFGLTPSGSVTATESTTDTEEQDTSSSVVFNKLSTFDTQVLGPASNTVGLDHDFDTVTIWLNPVAEFTISTAGSPGTVQLNNYYYDTRDGGGTAPMDTVTLQVRQLKNPSLITNQFQLNQLMRSWSPNLADGSSPGLTAADLLQIAAADPFSVSTYSPTFTVFADGTCSTDMRFCKSTNPDIEYASPEQGGQNGPTKYGQAYTATATEGKGAKNTFSSGFSLDVSANGGFLVDFTVDLKTSDTLTWVNQWSSLTSQTTSQSATTTITPPTFSDNYTGPTEFEIFQDNIYGTFMFVTVPFPGFLLSANPASQTITVGGKAAYTVSTAIVDGFSGNVALSVASGLPTGATAAFSPASIAAGDSSTLTLTSTATTPPGTYTLTINGKFSTDLPHSVQVTLVVDAAPNFSISASPSSQTVTVGGKTTYTVSTSALHGFTGSESLTLAGLPSGASAAFSPTSITGTGTSTLTVTTSTSTPSGGYTLTIKGTSGSLTHTTTVTLVAAVATKNFTLSITPDSEGVTAGGKATFTVTTTAVNGFTGSVALTLAGLPSGAGGTFNPTSITGAGSSTLTVTTSTSTPVGNSTLTVTGTSGSLVHKANSFTLTVDAP